MATVWQLSEELCADSVVTRAMSDSDDDESHFSLPRSASERAVNFTGGIEVDGRQRFGMDAEAALEQERKHDPQLEAHLIQWLSAMTQRQFATDAKLSDLVRDGQLLCDVANVIQPNVCRQVSGKGSGIRSMHVIATYLNVCKTTFGLRPEEMVSASDLMQGTNRLELVRHLCALARYTKTLPQFSHIEFKGPARVQPNRSWSFRDAQQAEQRAFERAKSMGFREPVPLRSRLKDLLLVVLQIMLLVRSYTLATAFVCDRPAATAAAAAVDVVTQTIVPNVIAEPSWLDVLLFRGGASSSSSPPAPQPPPPPPPPATATTFVEELRIVWIDESCVAIRSTPLVQQLEAILAPQHAQLALERNRRIAEFCEVGIEVAMSVIALVGIVALLAGIDRWRRPGLVHATFLSIAVLPKLLLVECVHFVVDGFTGAPEELWRVAFLVVLVTLVAHQIRRLSQQQLPFTRRMANMVRFKSH
jgi:hypothetical protein